MFEEMKNFEIKPLIVDSFGVLCEEEEWAARNYTPRYRVQTYCWESIKRDCVLARVGPFNRTAAHSKGQLSISYSVTKTNNVRLRFRDERRTVLDAPKKSCVPLTWFSWRHDPTRKIKIFVSSCFSVIRVIHLRFLRPSSHSTHRNECTRTFLALGAAVDLMGCQKQCALDIPFKSHQFDRSQFSFAVLDQIRQNYTSCEQF